METTDQPEKEAPKRGCIVSLLKLVASIAIPVLILSLVLDWVKEISAVDDIGRSLIPFHNGYLSFDGYYFTVELLASNWPLRLLIVAAPSLMLLAIINAISSSVIKSEKANTIFIRILMMVFLGIVIGLVWLVPDTKTVIDVAGKQIVMTKFNITHFSTSTLPFDQIDEIWHEYKTRATSRDSYTKYLYIRVKAADGTVWLMGVQNAGSYAPTHGGYTESGFQLPITDQENAYGQMIVANVKKLMKI